MEDRNCWQKKFQPCQYSEKLVYKLAVLNSTANGPVDIQEVKKAIYYARKYHGDQKRLSGEPYYSHPIEVSYLFAEHTAEKNRQYYTTDLLITAILHDLIEDTELTKDKVAQIFSQSVADQVEDLTRIKFDQKISAGETVNMLFAQYKKDVLHIKLFDRLHNAQTIGAVVPKKARKIIDETVVYFIPLASYLETSEVKEKLIRICDNVNFSKQSACQCQQNQANGFCYCNSPFSLVLRNIINQTHMQ
jgi:(p)ppGpp synthase/HD superfamily hydrolase